MKAETAVRANEERVVIEPRAETARANLCDIWRYRKLLFYLCRRFTKSFYRGTTIGVGWILIRALVPALMIAAVFGGIAKIPSNGLPYLLFLFSGLCVWSLFANSMRILTRSLKIGRRLVLHLHFPRILLLLASLSVVLIEFAVNLTLLALMGVFFEATGRGGSFQPGFHSVLIPAYVLLALLFTLGVGFFTSVLSTRTRDVRFSVPYLVQLFFLATPVSYPLSLVPEKWRWAAAFNPMAGAVEGFRWCLFGGVAPPFWMQAGSVAGVLVTFLAGLWFFTKAEATLSDYV